MPWFIESYKEKARRIIAANSYLVLSTSDKKGNVWANTVTYAYDKDYNFYFLSAIDSKHAKNIAENPKIAIVIFDSTQPIGSDDEVQAAGESKSSREEQTWPGNRTLLQEDFPGSPMPAKNRYPPEN